VPRGVSPNALAGGMGSHLSRCDWVDPPEGFEVLGMGAGDCNIGCVDPTTGTLNADCTDFRNPFVPGGHAIDELVDPTICPSGDDDDDTGTDGGDDDDDGPPIGPDDPSSDSADNFQFYCFYDLRDRESFCQATNLGKDDITVHVQVFNVAENCNENNFFDNYTPNDTHIYDLNNIETNDGSPSGIDLQPGAYGFVVVTVVDGIGGFATEGSIIGNFRVIGSDGTEYRTNALGIAILNERPSDLTNEYTFNFNQIIDVTLSDVVGIAVDNIMGDEVKASNILNIFRKFEVNILNNNENVFSCRDIVFSCTDQDHPLLEGLLENSGSSVASFEYGINNELDHSKGGELLCPGNNITEGIVKLNHLMPTGAFDLFVGYVGLNNGNGRGSMDSFWGENLFISDGGDDM